MVGEFFDNGGFGFANAHDSAPPSVDGMGGVGEDDFVEEFLEFLLDDGGLAHFGCVFCLEIEVPAAAKENSAANISEVVVAFFVVECAFEGEIWDGVCDEDLGAGGFDILIGEELFSESVCADEELFCLDLGDFVRVDGDVIFFFGEMTGGYSVDDFYAGGNCLLS